MMKKTINWIRGLWRSRRSRTTLTVLDEAKMTLMEMKEDMDAMSGTHEAMVADGINRKTATIKARRPACHDPNCPTCKSIRDSYVRRAADRIK